MHCPTHSELEKFAAQRKQYNSAPNESALAGSSERRCHIDQHLNSCSHCRRLVDEIDSGDKLLGQLRAAVADNNGSHSSATAPLLSVGDVMKNYRLTSKLYSGGQADVFAAILNNDFESKEVDANNPVRNGGNAKVQQFAIKIWRQRLTSESDHRIRFQRELLAVRSFDHPAIVPAIDGGIENEVGFLVMPLVEGAPIDRLSDWQRSSRDELLRRCMVLLRVCEGVAYAHSRGTFHRDLKPANILVDEKDSPTILDFGLAKSLNTGNLRATSQSEIDHSPTMTGQFLGTLAFAAPEQTIGLPEKVDARCDVYALGVTAYLILAGRMPYRTSGPVAEVITNIQSAQILPPSRFQQEVNRDLDAIIMKALEREPRDRYQTVDALRADFQNYLNGDLIEARRHSHWHLLAKSIRKNAWAAMATCTILISLVVAGVLGSVALFQTKRALRLSDEKLDREKLLSQAAVEAQQQAEEQAYMASVTAATMAGNPRSAREWLDNAPESLRKWEWQYLRRVSDQTGKLLEGHVRYVEAVRSAGENRVLSTGWDGQLKVWDLEENREIKSFSLHKHVWGLAISPDQQIAAVGDFDGRVHILDLVEYKVIHVIDGPDAPVFGCSFNKDGTELACNFSKSKQSLAPPMLSTVCIFDCADWSLKQSIELETSTRVVVPYQDDEWFVSGLGMSALISTSAGLVKDLPPSTSLCFSAKTGLLYLAEFGRQLLALDPKRGFDKPVWEFDGGVINELAVNNEGDQIAIAGRQSVVKVLRAASGQVLHERVGHDWAVSSCDFVGADHLVTGGWDKTVRTWNLNPAGSIYQQWHGHYGPVHFLKCSKSCVWTGGKDGTLRVWSWDGKTLQINELGAPVWCMAINPSGDRACIGLGNGEMILADIVEGRISKRDAIQLAKEGGVHDIVFVEADQVIACTANNLLATYDLKERKVVHEDRSHRGHIHRVVRSQIDQRLFTADHDVIRIWDKDSMEVVEELRRSIYQDDFSLEIVGNQILAGRNPGQIGIWEYKSDGSAELVDTLNGHGDEVLDFAVHPDKTRLVSCAADGSTKIWDLKNRKLLTLVESGNAQLCRIEFDPTGEVLVGGAKDGRIMVWKLEERTKQNGNAHGKLNGSGKGHAG